MHCSSNTVLEKKGTPAQGGGQRLSDELSAQNSIVILEAPRTPLIIDPAAQATGWLRARPGGEGGPGNRCQGATPHSKNNASICKFTILDFIYIKASRLTFFYNVPPPPHPLLDGSPTPFSPPPLGPPRGAARDGGGDAAGGRAVRHDPRARRPLRQDPHRHRGVPRGGGVGVGGCPCGRWHWRACCTLLAVPGEGTLGHHRRPGRFPKVGSAAPKVSVASSLLHPQRSWCHPVPSELAIRVFLAGFYPLAPASEEEGEHGRSTIFTALSDDRLCETIMGAPGRMANHPTHGVRCHSTIILRVPAGGPGGAAALPAAAAGPRDQRPQEVRPGRRQAGRLAGRLPGRLPFPCPQREAGQPFGGFRFFPTPHPSPHLPAIGTSHCEAVQAEPSIGKGGLGSGSSW